MVCPDGAGVGTTSSVCSDLMMVGEVFYKLNSKEVYFKKPML